MAPKIEAQTEADDAQTQTDYPVVEPGVTFEWRCGRVTEVLSLFVDEDGNTQARVKGGYPQLRDMKELTVAVSDIHEKYDEGAITVKDDN